jgi:hypothetical protein
VNQPTPTIDARVLKHFPGKAEELTSQGGWFMDAYGRYALFRGVNIGSQSKHGPLYLPVKVSSYSDVEKELKNIAPCLDFLKELGFNVVRLPIMWKGLEPAPGTNTNQEYLEGLSKVIEALVKEDIFVIIDFHQDLAHELYGGDGFPDWAIAVDKNHPLPGSPPKPNARWQLRYVDPPWYVRWLSGVSESEVKATRNTLRSFWNNSTDNTCWQLTNYPTQDHLLKTVHQTAAFYSHRGNRGIIGYEPFNEPNPVGLARSNFEAVVLTRFYKDALEQVRKADPRLFLFAEPRTDWNVLPADASENRQFPFITEAGGIRTYLGKLENPKDLSANVSVEDNVVFSFHFYDPWTFFYDLLPVPIGPRADSMKNKMADWPRYFQVMLNAAKDRGMIPFLTEFGSKFAWRGLKTHLRKGFYDTQDRAYLDLGFQQFEANLLNTTLWCYDFYAASPAAGGDGWNNESFSLLETNHNGWKIRNSDIIARPYPMRSSAKPEFLSFDAESRQAAIILTGKPVSEPTVIYVPRDIQYPNQFEIHATSSGIRWDDSNQRLYWAPDATLATNQIIICPVKGFLPEKLPPTSRQLLSITTNIVSWQN